MHSLIGARPETAPAEHVRPLPGSARGQEHLRSDRITRTLWAADQLQNNPVVVVLNDVPEQCGCGIDIVRHNVDMAVIEKISESRAASGNDVSQAAAGSGRHFGKLYSIQISKQLRALCPGCAPVLPIDTRIDVAVRYNNVEEPVIVKIKKPRSPRKKGNGGVSQAGPIRHIGKVSVAVVPVQRVVVVGKCAYIKINLAVPVVVSYGNAHRCLRAPVFGQSKT